MALGLLEEDEEFDPVERAFGRRALGEEPGEPPISAKVPRPDYGGPVGPELDPVERAFGPLQPMGLGEPPAPQEPEPLPQQIPTFGARPRATGLTPPKELESRNVLRDIVSAAKRGIEVELPLLATKALEATPAGEKVTEVVSRFAHFMEGVPYSGVADLGTTIDQLEAKGETPELMMSKEARESLFRRAIYGGVSSGIPSIAAGILGLGASMVMRVAKIPVVLSKLASYSLSGGTVFGMAEYTDFMRDYKKETEARAAEGLPPAMTEKTAKALAVSSAIVEGGLEFLADYLGGKLWQGAALSKPLTNTIKQMWKQPLRQTIKDSGKALVVEPGTEFIQESSETWLREKAGIPTGVSPWKAGTEAIGPAIVMTLMMALGIKGGKFLSQQELTDRLTNPDRNREDRTAGANEVYTGLLQEAQDFSKKGDTESALQLRDMARAWQNQALYNINRDEAIPLDQDLISAQQEYLKRTKPEERPPEMGGPTPKEGAPKPPSVTPPAQGEEKPPEELKKEEQGFIPSKEMWDTAFDRVEEAKILGGEAIQGEEKRISDRIKILQGELKKTKGRGAAERKKEVNEAIKKEKADLLKKRERFDEGVLENELAFRADAEERAKKAGLTDENKLVDFLGELGERVTEPQYFEVNKGKTYQMIFDEVIDDYVKRAPEEVGKKEEAPPPSIPEPSPPTEPVTPEKAVETPKKLHPRYQPTVTELYQLVKEGQTGKRVGTKEKVTAAWGSSFPTFMKNKGWGKEKVLAAIEKGNAGQKLGVQEAKIWDAVRTESMSLFRDEVRRAQEGRVTSIPTGELEVGDKIKVQGEVLSVTEKNDEKIVIQDGRTYELDPYFDKIKGKLIPRAPRVQVEKITPETPKAPSEMTDEEMDAFIAAQEEVKIGDAKKVMGTNTVVADTQTIDRVRYELYNGEKLKDTRGWVRVYDIDSGNVVSLKQFPTFDQAEKEYNNAIKVLKKGVKGPELPPGGEITPPPPPTPAPEAVVPPAAGPAMQEGVKKPPAGPERRRNFGFGKLGMITVNFPDEHHAILSATPTRFRNQLEGKPSPLPATEKQLRTWFKIPEGQQPYGVANDYLNFVKSRAKEALQGGANAFEAPTYAEFVASQAVTPTPAPAAKPVTWDTVSDEERAFWVDKVGAGEEDTAQAIFGAFKGDFAKASPGSKYHDQWRTIRAKEPVPAAAPKTAKQQLSDFVKVNLYEGKPITHEQLVSEANKAFGGTQAEGKYTARQMYDALEVGVNKFILEQEIDPGTAGEMGLVEDIINRIPIQKSIRTEEQQEFQQFSTPPTLAFIMNWVANIQAGETMLEPSAGNGGLVVFAKNAGAVTIANELSAERQENLASLGAADRIFKENAEQLNNILPPDIQPTVVVMNPPFSATAGRLPGKRQALFATAHVDQALARLQTNGRAVILLGKGFTPQAANLKEWFGKLFANFNVRANIEIGGKDYKKYGTEYGSRLYVVDKIGPTDQAAIVTGTAERFDDLIPLLEGVRNVRQTIFPRGEQAQPPPAVPGGAPEAPRVKRPAGPGLPLPAPTPGVGPGQPGVGPEGEARAPGIPGIAIPKPPEVRPEIPPGERGGARRPERLGAQPPGPKPAEGAPGSEPVIGGPSGERIEGRPEIPGVLPPEPIRVDTQQTLNGMTENAISNMIDEAISETEANIQIKAAPVPAPAGPVKTLEQQKLPPQVDGVVQDPSEQIEKIPGIGEAISKLDDLFGKRPGFKEEVVQYAVFDEALYTKVKPLFQQSFDAAKAAGQHPKILAKYFIQKYGAGVKPYLERFFNDSKAETQQPLSEEEEEKEAIFIPYKPRNKYESSKPHISDLVETAAMASVSSPKVSIKLNLEDDLIKTGKLSEAQLEGIQLALNSFSKQLPGGETAGFFIGDGTGVGKGREITGVIRHFWNSGKKKAVWITANPPLLEDAQRDWVALGGNATDLRAQSRIQTGNPIDFTQGILFSTYASLRQKLEVRGTELASKPAKEIPGKAPKPIPTRLDQLLSWLGKDFDGVIVFDEAHYMKNALAVSGARGMSKPSLVGMMGVEIQKRLPNAKFVYSSATGATDVHSLAYLERLGLWGEGTAFANKQSFVQQIIGGGLAAMEVVARDLKAAGKYLSRSISFKGVEYDKIEHRLTPEQRETYDTLARSWQIVLKNLNAALVVTGQAQSKGAKRNSKSIFWGSLQRFFNQTINAMQMPSVMAHARKQLEAGNSLVFQLVNTFAAATDRELERIEAEGGTLEDLDLTPRTILLEYLDRAFPTQQFEDVYDPTTNTTIARPVFDSEGNAVHNQEAVEMKKELMAHVQTLSIPDNPLNMLINEFGFDNVAEVTGRDKRIITIKEADGSQRMSEEKRSRAKSMNEVDEFMDGKRRILVFSDAGGTGRSYHSDLDATNQERRVHYVIQPGWRADNAIQGMGRTHRSNQRVPPLYFLAHTNLKSQKRFISTIARRLDQLGALTKGQRQAGSTGLFTAADNLESRYARGGINHFFKDLHQGQIEGLSFDAVTDMMGLAGMVDENGNLIEGKIPEPTTFMNRMLTLEVSMMDKIFDEFNHRLETAVEVAIANGTLDFGVENYTADSIVLKEKKTLLTKPETDETTIYAKFEAVQRIGIRTLDEVYSKFEISKIKFPDAVRGFFRNVESGRIWAVRKVGTATLPNGSVVDRLVAWGPYDNQVQYMTDPEFSYATADQAESGKMYFNPRFIEIRKDEGEAWWNNQLITQEATRKETVHVVTGSLLPVWDRIPFREGQNVRVYRMVTDGKERFLGRVIPPKEVAQLMQNFSMSTETPAFTFPELINAVRSGGELHLSNGWRIGRRTVQNDAYLEIMGPNVLEFRDELRDKGAQIITIRFSQRIFIPNNERAAGVLEKILAHRQVVKVIEGTNEGFRERNQTYEREAFGDDELQFEPREDPDVRNPVAPKKWETERWKTRAAIKQRSDLPDFMQRFYRGIENGEVQIRLPHGILIKESEKGLIEKALAWLKENGAEWKFGGNWVFKGAGALVREQVQLKGVEREEAIKTIAMGINLDIQDQIEKTGVLSVMGKELKTASQLAQLGEVFRDVRMEHLRVVATKGGNVEGIYHLTSKVSGAIYIEADKLMADIKELMERTGADSYWIVHNHPSGNPIPSDDDLITHDKILKKAKDLPYVFKGQVIINGKSFGFMPNTELAAGERSYQKPWAKEFTPLERDYTLDPLKPTINHRLIGYQVFNQKDAANVARALHPSLGRMQIVMLDTGLKIRAIEDAPLGMLDYVSTTGRTGLEDHLEKRMEEIGATQAMVITNTTADDTRYMNTLYGLMGQGWILDAYAGNMVLTETSRGKLLAHNKMPPWLQKAHQDAYTRSIKDVTLPAGMDFVFKAPQRDYIVMPQGMTDINSNFQNVEQRLKAAKGFRTASMFERARNWGLSLVQSFTRQLPKLPPKRYGQALDILRRYAENPRYSRDVATNAINEVVKDLSKQQYQIFSRVIILEDLLRDLDSGLLESTGPLPFDYQNRQQIEQDYQKYLDIADINPEITEAYGRRADLMKSLRQRLVMTGLLPAAVLREERYFHHQVLEYMVEKHYPGLSSKDVRLHRKGWQIARKGTDLDFNTEYIEAEFEVISQAISQLETVKTLDEMKATEDIVPRLKVQAKHAGLTANDWKQFIPEGYVPWQPKEGRHFYLANTISDRILQQVFNREKELELGDIKLALAMGRKRLEWAIPKELAETLDNFKDFKDEGPLMHFTDATLASWKQWKLINPIRVVKYNINNFSGDLDIVLAYNPKILGEFKKAAVDLLDYQVRHKDINPALRAELDYWSRTGVIGSGMTIAEIPDIKEIGIFKHLMGGSENIVKEYFWNKPRLYTNWRENILRLAAARFFQKQLNRGAQLYGASIREQIDSMTNNDLKAAKLARELIGDYGNVSQAGLWLRRHLIPFYSWMEINAPRYVRLFKNMKYEGRARGGAVAAGAFAVAKKTAGLTFKTLMLYMLVNLWNSTFFPEEEREIGMSGRRQLHLILPPGRRSDGTVFTIRFQGALSDALSWFGLEDFPDDFRDVMSGKKKWTKQLKEMAWAAPEKLVQAARPIEKSLAEAFLFKKSIYPEITKPRPIRDPVEHLFRVVDLDIPYRYAIGRPTRGVESEVGGVFTYKTDTGEQAYYDILNTARNYLEDQGVTEIPMFNPTPKSNALYYYKQAQRFGEKDKAQKYMNEYLKLGGKREDLMRSLKKAHPLAFVPVKFRQGFLSSLDGDDRAKLKSAQDWWKKVYGQ